MSQGRALHFLKWIKDDLNELILDAREALDMFVEHDRIAIGLCVERLHQLHGTLQMVQIYGPAMLAEEMEAVANWIQEQTSGQTDDAAQALMQSLIRLPNYLEKVSEGMPDSPFYVLDLLNDLRAVREAPLLTEASLFSSEVKQAPVPDQVDGVANSTIPPLVQRIRGHFHKGLLEWFRDGASGEGIERLANVAKLVREQAHTEPVYSLFRMAEALARGILEGSVNANIALKATYGKLDTVLKAMLESGEDAVDAGVAGELANNFLYYLIHADSNDPLIHEVRSDYGLDQVALPSAQQINEGRKHLSRPGEDLYASVQQELAAEMQRLKDALDEFIRSDRDDQTVLGELITPTRKMADTLGVLGYGNLRSRLLRQVEKLQEIVDCVLAADDDVLMDMAAELLFVEQNMQVVPQAIEAVNEWNTPVLTDDENQQLTVDTLHQALEEMHQVKLMIEDIVAGRSRDKLDGVLVRLYQVIGALKLLEYEQAADLLEHARTYVEQHLLDNEATEELDGLADLMIGIELYMEARQQRHEDADRYLAIAAEGLKKLPVYNPQEETAETIEPEAPAIEEEPSDIQPEPESAEATMSEDIDPEILEIFIEEAREELDVIEDYVPRWISDTSDSDALVTFRRSFHTLKGSGRLVGANLIGEFAWSIENLLNRVIDKQVTESPALFYVLKETLKILPELVDCQESNQQPQSEYRKLAKQADALANGEEIAFDEAEEFETVDQEPVEIHDESQPDQSIDHVIADVDETSGALIQLDPELHQVFSTEAQTHLKAIEDFLAACQQNTGGNCEIDSSLHRALHTLKGSAQVANVEPIAELSRALEELLKVLVDSERHVDSSVFDLLDESVAAMTDVLSVINVSGVQVPDVNPLIEQAVSIASECEQEIRDREHSAVSAESHTPMIESPEVESREVSEEADDDDELRLIFLEEAIDLVEELEEGLSHWRENPQVFSSLEDVQRTLHTLKGGARLAGQLAVGDLSHAFESLLVGISDKRLDVSDDILNLVQQASDQLAMQVDQMRTGEAMPAEDLVRQLEAALNSEPVVESQPNKVDDFVEEEDVAVNETVQSTDDEEISGLQFTAIPTMDEEVRQSAASSQGVARSPQDRHEQVKVASGLLDQLVNNAGEISIVRSRLEQHNSQIGFNLDELDRTVDRLHHQLRKLDMETEAQILHRFERERAVPGDKTPAFDPLELDRFSTMQQLSRSLMETVNDLVSIKETLGDLQRESDTILLQQSRLSSSVQDGLLRTRMVRFSQQVPRLQRLVRQTCSTLDKQADLEVFGAEEELDRAILDRMVSPLEHILRNAVSHGIESSEDRTTAGKPAVGNIQIHMGRQGAEIVLTVSDDGKGLDLESIRNQAIEKGLLDEGVEIKDRDLMQFVLETGFSTAQEVTQVAGRGVGMDVVANEVKQLGGSLEIDSQAGKGTRFTMRLPLTLAIADAMLVTQGDDVYAIPHTGIEGVVRISRDKLNDCYLRNKNGFEYAGREYPVRYLGQLLELAEPELSPGQKWFPMLLVKAGEQRLALHIDSFIGNRQIVVKSVGMQLSTVRWISGGTILGNGQVALILDVHALARMAAAHSRTRIEIQSHSRDPDVTVMVVDDSITVRKVTSRLLKRQNMGVILAKDGVDAVTQLQQEKLPDVMLLDIEMPRMDGYELARHMRSSDRLKHIPIIMITSRVGDKHRRQAMELGVKRYLGKPYQETELMDNIYAVLAEAYV